MCFPSRGLPLVLCDRNWKRPSPGPTRPVSALLGTTRCRECLGNSTIPEHSAPGRETAKPPSPVQIRAAPPNSSWKSARVVGDAAASRANRHQTDTRTREGRARGSPTLENMEHGQLNWVANFIWGIADDVLRDLYSPWEVPGRHPAHDGPSTPGRRPRADETDRIRHEDVARQGEDHEPGAEERLVDMGFPGYRGA